MKLKEILDYIPKEKLNCFTLEYNVDNQVKKLNGEVIFYLLLFSMLNVREVTLRTLEQFYNSRVFKGVVGKEVNPAKYNSISSRLKKINPEYFKAIFEDMFERYHKEYLKAKDNIIAFDSTVVSLSSKLLKEGLKVNQYQTKTAIKFSVAFSTVPIKSKLFTQQKYISEDVALKDADFRLQPQ